MNDEIISYHLAIDKRPRTKKEIDNIVSMLNELSRLDREVLSND